MKITKVKINGFRNFKSSVINFNDRTLIIGGNDVGKTNLLHALRIMLDKSLSERDIEPEETDFFIDPSGAQADSFTIQIYFSEIVEDAVLSSLKGNVNDAGECVISFYAERGSLDYKLYIGSADEQSEEIASRYYLKQLNLRYMKSSRDLQKFIQSEKKKLLKQSQEMLDDASVAKDSMDMLVISDKLDEVNQKVAELNYVKDATTIINQEIKKLSHSYGDYDVHLDTGAIKVNQFIENLQLGASSSGSKMLLGGDGRNK